jgi:hypothetical protein
LRGRYASKSRPIRELSQSNWCCSRMPSVHSEKSQAGER